MNMQFSQQDAPLLIVMGQSNAHGHGTRLPEAEQIHRPLKNVWGLDRARNQQYGLQDVTWSGFLSAGMNLGESQDDTVCLANCFARLWQERIDSGELLPDLYVIQISIGAMGIAREEVRGWNMWYPGRERRMKPGPLGEVDISLYPLAVEILGLAVKNLTASGKNPRILGLHWNQWETEVDTGGEAVEHAAENFAGLFDGFRRAVGIPCPIWLYYPRATAYNNPEGVEKVRAVLQSFVDSGEDYRFMDAAQSPYWDPQNPHLGIFAQDNAHYTPQVQRWFAWRQMEAL